MRKLPRAVWSIFLSLGLVAAAIAVPPAHAAQSLGDFYNSTSIHEVYITLDSASIANLNKTPKDYTMAQVELKSTGGTSGKFSTGVRLKGSTSLEKLAADLLSNSSSTGAT